MLNYPHSAISQRLFSLIDVVTPSNTGFIVYVPLPHLDSYNTILLAYVALAACDRVLTSRCSVSFFFVVAVLRPSHAIALLPLF